VAPPFKLSSPLPAADLLFQAMTLSQGLSTLEEMQLQLLSDRPDLQAEDLLGRPMGVTSELRESGQRHFNGLVTRFGTAASQGSRFGYQATVRPWLWFLTRTSDCRIFQEQTVQEIVEAVFADHAGIASYEFKLFRSYRPRVYCVQYRESDFNFVARLLEDEGIYWYFVHDESSHKLMLVDDIGAHTAVPGYEALPYYANSGQVPPDAEYISKWTFSREVRTGKVALRSYDFERPSTDLGVARSLLREHEQADLEQYDWQGDYTAKADGQQLIDNHVDELQSGHEKLSGQTNAHGLSVGHLVHDERHPRADQNARVPVRGQPDHGPGPWLRSRPRGRRLPLQLHGHALGPAVPPAAAHPQALRAGPADGGGGGPGRRGDLHRQVRPREGAVPLGPLRQEEREEQCWVRVSSPGPARASASSGAAHRAGGGGRLPRRRPRPADDHRPRLQRRADAAVGTAGQHDTQSGVLSRSSKGGAYGNANALRFEDKKGSEQVWLHAEKNQDIEVENDETHWVGHDRRKTIDHDETVHVKHDRTETVDNDEQVTVHHDRRERVDNDETLSIGRDRSLTVGQDKLEKVLRNKTVNVLNDHEETIGSSMTVSVGKNLTEVVALNYAETVGAAMELTVGAALAISVGGAMAETVGAVKVETVGGAKTESIGASKSVQVGTNLTEAVGKALDLTVGTDHTEKAGGKRRQEVAKEFSLHAKKVQITADDEISFKTGSAEIVLKKNGDIVIKGGKINIKGSSDVVIKGSKILEN
jgi:type VI secretion system secreted protein VgrG